MVMSKFPLANVFHKMLIFNNFKSLILTFQVLCLIKISTGKNVSSHNAKKILDIFNA
jgi:hypothetical protein